MTWYDAYNADDPVQGRAPAPVTAAGARATGNSVSDCQGAVDMEQVLGSAALANALPSRTLVRVCVCVYACVCVYVHVHVCAYVRARSLGGRACSRDFSPQAHAHALACVLPLAPNNQCTHLQDHLPARTAGAIGGKPPVEHKGGRKKKSKVLRTCCIRAYVLRTCAAHMLRTCCVRCLLPLSSKSLAASGGPPMCVHGYVCTNIGVPLINCAATGGRLRRTAEREGGPPSTACECGCC